MDSNKFAKVAESLRQFRRAELKDFETEVGGKPVDVLYVDPLPGDSILQSVTSSNTTFVLGRKGTGKSTVFAKAQSVLRTNKQVISIYIDVKTIYEVLPSPDAAIVDKSIDDVAPEIIKAHLLRKTILRQVLADLLKELELACEGLSILERWLGKKKPYHTLMASLEDIKKRLKESSLEAHEIPILQKITKQVRRKQQEEIEKTKKAASSMEGGESGASFNASYDATDFDRTLEDNDIYKEYSDLVLMSFPFNELITEIKDLLAEAGLQRLVIFFDDFSELVYLDQRLFVDVILSPLNNSSNEAIKLKIAGYPGRVYYGKIDPGKVDTIMLDFCELYEATEVQEMEASATSYTSRLLKTRFNAFGCEIDDYFDTSSTPMDSYMLLIFQASFNVPRIMGYLLQFCHFDRISKGNKINSAAIRLAARKYYEQTISKYFDRFNRYALEPFENKIDRNNQRQLLDCLIQEARLVRKNIQDGSIGGTYFQSLSNPPTSHFIVTPNLENVFLSLESNFLLSKYKNTRDKNGKPVCVYALYYGLCENERMAWGYPEGREFRNYFVQRCFDFTRAVHDFLSNNQTIKCSSCGTCFPLEQKQSFELFKWRCPECQDGTCSIVNLSDDFKAEVDSLSKEIMLEPIELEILETLEIEKRRMKAGEISALIDQTYQMVGKRTTKLQEMGLVEKERDFEDGKMKSSITSRAETTYFSARQEG